MNFEQIVAAFLVKVKNLVYLYKNIHIIIYTYVDIIYVYMMYN